MSWDADFFSDVSHLPAVRATSSQGADLITHPGPGTAVKASCQSRRIQRVEPDGRLVSVTLWQVFFPVDPASLNGGTGINVDDIIQYGNFKLVVQSVHVPEPSRTDVFPLWRCEAVEKS